MGLRLATGALLALAVLGACGDDGPPQFTEDNIADPAGFLVAVEKQWRKDLSARQATVHREARCYFAKRKNADTLEPLTYCGPVHHLQESGHSAASDSKGPKVSSNPGSWDTYGFSLASSDDTIHLSKPSIDARGAWVTNSHVLLRPDGLEPPEDAAEFAKPDQPTTESGFVTTVEDLHVTETEQPDEGRIVTPLTIVEVEQVGSVETIDDDSEAKVPADGESFRTLTLSFLRGPYANAYDDAGGPSGEGDGEYVDASVAYAVDIDGERTPIFEEGTPDRSVTVVASVPENGDAEIVVSVAGNEQTISFTTGDRTSETADLFYRDDAQIELSEQYPASTDEQGDFSVTHSLQFSDAMLTPFHPVYGWAEEGRSWLVVEPSGVRFDWPTDDYRLQVDRAASATVETAAGDASNDVSESVEYETFVPQDGLSMVFDVPEEESRFELTYQPTLTFTTTGDADPPSGSALLEPVTVELAFGER